MKQYQPPQYLLNLDLILKYDRERTSILSETERRQINFARSKIMREEAYCLDKNLQSKIDFNLGVIKKSEWKPEFPILYGSKKIDNE